jgi:hypothetical protein
VVGRDRLEIDKWIREQKLTYVILLDLQGQLAGRLGVDGYPTYIFFDVKGNEIARAADVRVAHNWFDRDRWLERAGAVQPASAAAPAPE